MEKVSTSVGIGSGRNWAMAAAGAVALGIAIDKFRSWRGISFRNRVVLITGGSRGLGFILARRFADEGAKVVICARDSKELKRACRDLEERGADVMTVVCDVGNREQVQDMIQAVFRRFGWIDVLVNNASIIEVGPVESMSEQDFRAAMDVNFWGTVNTTLAALPILARGGQGRVVNITSIGGAVAVPHLLPYTCAKFAAVGFSRGLRSEVARRGVKVVTVVPGLMRTGSFINALFKGKREQEFNWFAVSSALPGVSMNADRAARKIVEATRIGRAFVTLGMPAKLLRLFNGMFPSVSAGIFEQVDQLLPKSEWGAGKYEKAEPGWMHKSGLSYSGLTALGHRAAREFNEVDGHG